VQLALDVGAHLDGLTGFALRHEQRLTQAGKLVVDHRLLQPTPICRQTLVQGNGVTLCTGSNAEFIAHNLEGTALFTVFDSVAFHACRTKSSRQRLSGVTSACGETRPASI